MVTKRPRRLTEREMAICEAAAAGCVAGRTRRASRAVAQHYNEAMRGSGLLGTQFTLLAALALRGPTTITDLGAALVLDRTTLTRNLRPLEKRGLVTVAPGEDRRTRVVAITEAGGEALSRVLPLWKKAQAEVVGKLGERRWAAMNADLSELVALLQGE